MSVKKFYNVRLTSLFLNPFSWFCFIAVCDDFPDIGSRGPIGRINSGDVVRDLMIVNEFAWQIIDLQVGVLEGGADVQHILTRIGISDGNLQAVVVRLLDTNKSLGRELCQNIVVDVCVIQFVTIG